MPTRADPTLAVSVADLTASYGQDPVLQGISMDLPPGELLAVLGPSGCGKTTLLRCLAGFERIEAGRISLADSVVALPRVHVPAHRRQVAVVPQEGALFPHLSVAENVGFGLRRRRPGRMARIRECLALVDLAGYGDRMPHELSGGQQQRVALARAMAPKPPLILLDEPFGALDASLRVGLRRDVRAALKEDGATAVLVTHDQAEALSVADRVAVLKDGRLRQLGTPEEVYTHPADAWVAGFVGEATLLPVLALADDAGTPLAHTVLGPVPLAGPHAAAAQPGDLVVVRPEAIAVEAAAGTQTNGSGAGAAESRVGVAGVVTSVDYRGHESVADVALPEGTVLRAHVRGTGTGPVQVRVQSPCAVVPSA
ncbi:ABC transporter ATP-binding protein [Micrococcus sp.]|uniref:ABC transporter ATP-binding protein n=1 Tax=Micrococcus sp. TaxID=1271 RepID=UPI002A90FE36|nr:ABC transporter ATP-binding protein [Micrococcus sp.]MDY6054714.1 ABC transporter ATP-binding protein [Micrococcus sp.]